MFDEVYGDGAPQVGRNQELFEESVQFVMRGLQSSAGSTRIAVVLDEGPHIGPGVFLTDQFQSLVLTEVSRNRVIVLVLQDTKLKVRNIWNINLAIK